MSGESQKITAAREPSVGAEVAVRLPLPLRDLYDYAVPDDLDVVPGSFVLVPFGRRQVVGVAWGPGSQSLPAERLRPIDAVLTIPPLPAPMRRFVEWVANYVLVSSGTILKMVMSVPDALEPPRPRMLLVRGETAPERMTAARTKVLAAAADGVPRTAAALAAEAGVGTAVVRGLATAGALRTIAAPPDDGWPTPDLLLPGPVLSEAQQMAAQDLAAGAGSGGYAVTLLDGVTGSGKTEVYFEAVAAALAAGKQVLVLLPEIALGAQWLDRFRRRFGVVPAAWHSDLTQSQRRAVWRGVAEGHIRIVVGARSALFLPLAELGLIVVDEEHDAAYKQEDGVIYNARDMAVVRAHLADIPVVLVSATPSLETFANIGAGRYRQLHLPDRFAGAALPEVSVVDLRRDPPPRNSWLSPPLVAAMEQTLEAGEQAMLFLNRRGYAPLTLCRACGYRLQCPNCSAWLVEHRLVGRLSCHHCGHSAPLPETCPQCQAADSLAACGPGVERLAEEVKMRFPNARTAMMTSDSVAGPVAAAGLIRRMEEGEIDLLIGTQMITKGYHFPNLTLVGVVDADLGLTGGDLRAAERTYQLLSQVAGRAGRAERPGRVLLQTVEPGHPVMQALVSGDRDGFLAAEMEARRAAEMPPFSRLAAVIVSSTSEGEARAAAAALGRSAPRDPGVVVLGPAPAPLAMLRGRHRFRLLVKAPRDVPLQAILRRWTGGKRWPKSVRVQIDIDPYSFL